MLQAEREMEFAPENKEIPQEISSVLLPMQSLSLLLPNAAVAEIVTGNIVPNTRTPNWHLGTLHWRTVNIPVISFEGLNDQPVKGELTRVPLVVINSYLGDESLPFYALRIHGMPRLVRVLSSDLELEPGRTLAAERVRVTLNGTRAAIPDLDFIERKILHRG